MSSDEEIPGDPPATPMSRGRMIVATTVISIIIAGQAYDIERARENWPFSNYPMFSRLPEQRDFSRFVLIGIPANRAPVDLGKPEYCAPMPPFHVRIAMDAASRSRKDPVAAMQAVARDYLRQYEARRKAGLHDGPPLRGIQVYQLNWDDVDSWAASARTPDSQTLIFDSRRPRAPVHVNGQNAEDIP